MKAGGRTELLDSETKTVDIQTKLEKALNAIGNVPKLYKQGDMQIKRATASSIFPKKFLFDGNRFRTDEMNSIAKYIFLTNSSLGDEKTDIKSLKILVPVK